MGHFPLRELGYAIGFVVLVAAIYVGAYYAMVERSGLRYIRTANQVPWFLPSYPMIESTYSFFAPMHEIDLRFRPDYWNPK
jgi:hypothetical protein